MPWRQRENIGLRGFLSTVYMDSYPQIAMRFRTKVFTLFLIVALLTASLIATFMYGPMKRLWI